MTMKYHENGNKMAHTTELKLYTFSELSAEAQAKAIEKRSEVNAELFSINLDYCDFEAIAKILGIEFNTCAVKTLGGEEITKPCIWWSGFYSQGDGLSFEGSYSYAKQCSKKIKEYAPQDAELHRIADELTKLQSNWFYGLTATITQYGRYYHSGTMYIDVEHVDGKDYFIEVSNDLLELIKSFADWMYKSLRQEYEYVTGEECCREALQDDDTLYTKDGTSF